MSDLPLDMIKIAIRSKNDPIRNNTQIYIADTYGELDILMQHCEFVFMGGSLVDHGGQNFIEAAAYGKTVIVGSYMYNFIDETEEFLKTNPHFVQAGPAGAGSTSNTKSETPSKVDVKSLDMRNPEHRKIYAEYRKTQGIV